MSCPIPNCGGTVRFFLLADEHGWPQDKATNNNDIPEMKPLALVSQIAEPWPVLTKFSRLLKLQRVKSNLARFVNNNRRPGERSCGPLAAEEIQLAMTKIV
jgi:hypothetical protein